MLTFERNAFNLYGLELNLNAYARILVNTLKVDWKLSKYDVIVQPLFRGILVHFAASVQTD